MPEERCLICHRTGSAHAEQDHPFWNLEFEKHEAMFDQYVKEGTLPREPQKYAYGKLQGTDEEKIVALGLINLGITSGYHPEELRSVMVTNRMVMHDNLLRRAGFDPDRLAVIVADILDFVGTDDMKHQCPECCPDLFNADGSRKDGNV